VSKCWRFGSGFRLEGLLGAAKALFAVSPAGVAFAREARFSVLAEERVSDLAERCQRALAAVLHPASSPYLFFVFDWTKRQLLFASTPPEHELQARRAEEDYIRKYGAKSLHRKYPGFRYRIFLPLPYSNRSSNISAPEMILRPASGIERMGSRDWRSSMVMHPAMVPA
jgi:hypothetical protein